MTTRTKITFAIYPNALGFGYALLKNPRSPIDCGVVKISPASNEKSFNRIQKFITYFEPSLIIVQQLSGKHSRKSKRVKKLLQKIISYCHTHNLRVKQYSREQVRLVFDQFGAKTKYEIAKVIVNWLPQFNHREPKFRKPWMAEDYNMGMFDAISLAITHYYYTD